MGSWLNRDGLQLFFGPQKTTPGPGGDFVSYGETRTYELTLNLATVTTTAAVVDFYTFFPANTFIEEVITDTEVGATGGTSLSLGMVQADQTTNISDTVFLSAAPIADHTTAGQKKSYTVGVTGVGTSVGTTVANAGYITVKSAGTYTLGTVKIRIKYRGIGTITQ